MFDCSNVRLFPPRFEDDLAIVDLVIRVVILFNFQLPIFKDQSRVFDISAEKAMEQENACMSFTFLAVSCQFQLPVQRTNPLL